jgi:hypothetical protein
MIRLKFVGVQRSLDGTGYPLWDISLRTDDPDARKHTRSIVGLVDWGLLPIRALKWRSDHVWN